MSDALLLSIVTPTRGNFSEFWLDHLLAIEGNVEFILVYYPNVPHRAIADTRVRQITSPYKGELMQRLIALLNAKGDYVLALDDDDFIHPHIYRLTCEYFRNFPDSIVLRPRLRRIDHKNTTALHAEWQPIPSLDSLTVARHPTPQTRKTTLQEIPIAPLNKSFDYRFLIWPFLEREDMEGAHMENFNNKIWKNEIVQNVVPEIFQTTQVLGAITWIPTSGLDRLLALHIQAKVFKKGAIIGHWMPPPAQVRFADKDPALKPPRFHLGSVILLMRNYPQYGYFWNLFFEQIYAVPKAVGKLLKWKLLNKQETLVKKH
jgi:glycosyltransferase involved in cell wall biosynthesis